MSIPSWPQTLPHDNDQSQWSLTPIVEIAASDFDRGPARRRRRFTAMRFSAQAELSLKASQLRIFKGFFFGELMQGCRKFTMPFFDGEGCVTVTALFDASQPYSISRQGNRSLVRLKIEILDLPMLDEGSMEFLSEFTEEDALAWSLSLHNWVNATYPTAVAPYA